MIQLREGYKFLSEGGLNLLAMFDCAALPEAVAQIMATSGVPLGDYQRLVLIGHGGRRMWDALQVWGMKTEDPIDHYSITLTRQFIHDYLGDMPVLWLYPGTDYLIPLQQLGEAAGWSYPSPLGSGISPVFGVWFAYRAAFLIDGDLPLVLEESSTSPCASCVHSPCIPTCPVGAVQQEAFDIDGCVQQRLRPGSPCADRCPARLACPYFPEQRYSLAQIRYHYGRSLETLRAWYGGSKE